MKFRAFLDVCSWNWGGRMWMALEMNVEYMLRFVKNYKWKTLQVNSYEKWNDMVTNWKYSLWISDFVSYWITVIYPDILE